MKETRKVGELKATEIAPLHFNNSSNDLNAIHWRKPPSALPHPNDVNLLDVFQHMVNIHGHKTAVKQGAKHYTYAELDQKSDTLAYSISKIHQLNPEDKIAVYLPRGIDEAIATLATLKLGCAYVPINLKDPLKRIEQILDDTQAKLILTNSTEASSLPTHQAKPYDVASVHTQAHQPYTNSRILPESLAYIMYTSGSTGRPKGVMIQHNAIIRFTASPEYVKINSTDNIAQLANPAFDAATFEFWTGLLNGCSLIYPDTEQQQAVLHPDNMRVFLSEQQVSVLYLSAVTFEQLAFQQPDLFKPLNYLVFGGDAANYKAVAKVIEAGKPNHIINGYGPTEATTFAIASEITLDNCRPSIPIGQPIDGTEIFLLNEQLRPVSDGDIGEICIAGKGLARGYLNLPEQSERSFIMLTLNGQSTRVYRTGDFGYRDSHGIYHYVGRQDDQIKLFGHRTELQEIKQKILSHPRVNQVEVMVTAKDAADKKLTAYIVGEESVSNTDLRDFCLQNLPYYMIPHEFVLLDHMPANLNGKVDSSAILNHQPEETMPKKLNIRVEAIITDIFAELLNISASDINDESFIDLGGNSILLVRLVDILRNRFDVAIGMEQLFTANTPSKIAQKIRKMKREEITTNKYDTLFQINEGDENKPPIVFIHPAGGHTFCYKPIIDSLIPLGYPCYVISEPSIKLGFALFESIPEVAECYLKLIENVLTEPTNVILSGYSAGGMVAAAMTLLASQNPSSHITFREIHLLDTWIISKADPAQKATLVDHLQRVYNYTQAGEQGPFLNELIRYWQELGLSFTPNRQLTTPTCLFRSNDSFNDISGINLIEISNDWTAYCENITVIPVEGTHESVMKPPHVDGLIEQIKAYLNRNDVNTQNKKMISRRIISKRNVATQKGYRKLKALPFFVGL